MPISTPPEGSSHRAGGGQVDGLVQLDFGLVVFGHHDHIFHFDEVFFLKFGQSRTHFKSFVFVIKSNYD